MSTPIYKLWAAQLGSTFVDQMENVSYKGGVEEFIARSNADIRTKFAAVGKQQPTIDMSTTNLAAGLAAGSSGWTVSGSTPASFWYPQYLLGGAIDTSATAFKLSMSQGLILPMRLSADQKGAKLDLQAVPIWDGSNAPFVPSTGATPTGSPSAVHYYVAGQVELAGTLINGTQNIDIDFGLKPILMGSNGIVYNDFGAREVSEPSITIKTTDIGNLATIGSLAAGGTAVFYFVAMSAYGGRIAAATASHVKISCALSMAYVDGIDPSGPTGAAVATIKVKPVWDGGSDDILVISTASAIS